MLGKVVIGGAGRYASPMADTPKTSETSLQIQIDDAVSHGQYVNMALINHTDTEFTLDLVHVQPHQPVAKVRSRVILHPKHAKRLMLALQQSVNVYEARFGPVSVSDDGSSVN